MSGHDIIVIGASAGGVETLTQLVRDLPADLPAAIFIVLHVPSNATSALPAILGRAGKLPTSHARDGETFQRGHIYIAPPNYHLLIKDGYIHLAAGPRENNHRPAIDPLFRTAARVYGPRVIGVILTGVLDDGTAGLLAIKARGGMAIVQDPSDAMYAGMPRSAIENVAVDFVQPLSSLASCLVQATYEPVPDATPGPEDMAMEADIAEMDRSVMHKAQRPGTPSEFACPECGGTLWELQDGHFIRYRCRTGHAYSPESLLAAQSEALEDALWAAMRALEERAVLSRHMAENANKRDHSAIAKRFEEQAQAAVQNAEVIRKAILSGIGTQNAEPQDESKPVSTLERGK